MARPQMSVHSSGEHWLPDLDFLGEGILTRVSGLQTNSRAILYPLLTALQASPFADFEGLAHCVIGRVLQIGGPVLTGALHDHNVVDVMLAPIEPLEKRLATDFDDFISPFSQLRLVPRDYPK